MGILKEIAISPVEVGGVHYDLALVQEGATADITKAFDAIYTKACTAKFDRDNDGLICDGTVDEEVAPEKAQDDTDISRLVAAYERSVRNAEYALKQKQITLQDIKDRMPDADSRDLANAMAKEARASALVDARRDGMEVIRRWVEGGQQDPVSAGGARALYLAFQDLHERNVFRREPDSVNMTTFDQDLNDFSIDQRRKARELFDSLLPKQHAIIDEAAIAVEPAYLPGMSDSNNFYMYREMLKHYDRVQDAKKEYVHAREVMFATEGQLQVRAADVKTSVENYNRLKQQWEHVQGIDIEKELGSRAKQMSGKLKQLHAVNARFNELDKKQVEFHKRRSEAMEPICNDMLAVLKLYQSDQISKEDYETRTSALRKESDILYDKFKQEDPTHELLNELKKFSTWFKAAQPTKVNTIGYMPRHPKRGVSNPEISGMVDMAHANMKKILDKRVWGDEVNFRWRTPSESEDGRSHYSRKDREFVMTKPSVGTAAHEMAHHLEYENPAVMYLTNKFRDYRVKRSGTPDESLAVKFPDHGYKEGEEGNPDSFFSDSDSNRYYTGKVYRGRDGSYKSTEIFTMGTEAILREPQKMFNEDPEFYALIAGIYDGTLLGVKRRRKL